MWRALLFSPWAIQLVLARPEPRGGGSRREVVEEEPDDLPGRVVAEDGRELPDGVVGRGWLTPNGRPNWARRQPINGG
jgi:hypothetical protein